MSRNQDRLRPVHLAIIDLFSGCGGLAEGFTQYGKGVFDLRLATDWDKAAIQTIQYNHPSVPVICGDVKKVSGHDLLGAANLGKGDVDMVIGGPPCQGFSMAGNRLLTDPRNQYFKDFVRLVREIEPSLVL